jgi:hypothetical protein
MTSGKFPHGELADILLVTGFNYTIAVIRQAGLSD